MEESLISSRRSYDGALCTIRYTGPVADTNGLWLGVEWDDPSRGKHDGSHKGTRYFRCLSRAPTAASFIRPSRQHDAPRTFLLALHDKYVADSVVENRGPYAEMVLFGTKPAQEMGFDKIRRQLARVEDLKVVILDGMLVAEAKGARDEGSVSERCPSITQLDLSRNLIRSMDVVVDICVDLPALRSLSLKFVPLYCHEPS